MKYQALNLIIAVTTVAIVGMIGQSFTSVQDDPWVVPDKFVEMENPIDGQLGLGKDMYNLHCKSCHGKEGLGDGSKAAQLDTPCGDFTTAEFAEQSDGALFYKTLMGRGDMPEFEKKMSHNEIWAVVNYIRTFE
jgi:mono/diheme cytochrome c family protein